MLGKKPKFHNSFLEALPEPCFYFHPDNRYGFCNKSAQSVLGILGYDKERRPEHYDAFLQVLRFSGKANGDSPVMFGENKYVLSFFPYEEGRVIRLMPITEDEHMGRLSSSLDIMPWGILTLDLSGSKPMVVFCNAKAGAFMGMPQQAIIGVPLSHIFKAIGVEEDFSDFFKTEEISRYNFEGRVAGKSCWLRFHFIPYHRTRPYCLIVVEDTTEEKVRENQYFQAQRLEALGQLAGGVAHDFNNILSIIDGYARMARKSVEKDSHAFSYMEHISKAVQRGASLTGQLLTFGRHKVSKDQVIDLGKLVADQEALLRPLLDASIALSIHTEENVCVQAPPDDLCQILINLCVNARDAMPRGGKLNIEARLSTNDRALLQIIDTGEGMTPEVKARIFDPFFTTKDQGKGTGLGLSMVYGLVKEMGGSIDVNSRPGQGTMFSIYIPLSVEKPDTHEMVETPDGRIQLKGFTAMIAEDEPDLLNLVSEMMEEMGARVLKARNGNEALQMQESYDGEIDFLITDVVMPEMNGVRLAELFAESRPRSRVMFMSGYPAHGQMARVTLPENAILMPKPVEYEKLCAIIKSLVATHNDNLKEHWKTLTGKWKSA